MDLKIIRHSLRTLIIIIILVSIYGCGITKPRGTGASGAGPYDPNYTSGISALHVSGNTIINAFGTQIVLQGINAIDPIKHSNDTGNYQGAGVFNETYYATMSAWGANVVRIPVQPDNWHSTSNASAVAIIDKAVGWAKAHNMYVILDFHSIGMLHTGIYQVDAFNDYSTSMNEVINFWNTMAIHYKNEPVVAAYEIFNEPVHIGSIYSMTDWASWKSDAESIIDSIRSLDPDKMIVVGGLQYAYDLSPAASTPISRTNIVYATHVYPKSNTNHSWDTAFGTLALSYPIIATEVGYLPGSTKDPIGELNYTPGTFHDDLKAYIKAKKISWIAWSFSTVWEPQLLNDTTSFTPSTAGSFFKNWLSGN